MVCGDVKANACHPRVPLLRLACLHTLTASLRPSFPSLRPPRSLASVPSPRLSAYTPPKRASPAGDGDDLFHWEATLIGVDGKVYMCVCVWCVTLRRRILIISKEGKPDSRRDDAYADSDLSSSRIVSTEVQCRTSQVSQGRRACVGSEDHVYSWPSYMWSGLAHLIGRRVSQDRLSEPSGRRASEL